MEVEFKDLGPQRFKNIAEPIRAYRVALSHALPPAARAPSSEPALDLPERPSIAVLPFANISDEPSQEYFTDGVTEDVITELSRFHSLFVIARNSTFTFKNKAVDAREVARELGVRYVLEGSIRRSNDRIRLTAQLIDAVTGNHVWADRFDRVLEDVFAVQEELTARIVTEIAPQIDATEREKARRRRPESLGAYDIAVRANANAWEALHKSNPELRNQAIAEARDALRIDPRSSLALNALACAQFQHLWFKTALNDAAAWQEGIDAGLRAIAIDPSDNQAHVWRGGLLAFAPARDRWDESLASLQKAHELNPNDVTALLVLGWMKTLAGDPHQGMEHVQRALRISPRDPLRHLLRSQLALSFMLARDYQNALEYSLLASNENSTLPSPYAFAAVAYVGLGDFDKAGRSVEKLRALAPEYLQSRLNGEVLAQTAEFRDRFTTFLRVAAGLEEPSAADRCR
jgi:adenylate cyclase